jgi:plasmid stabilization system protein ParE
MYTIIFKEDVSEEIANVYEWYEKKQPNLGEHFLDCMDKALALIQKNPKYFSFIHNSKRRIVVKGFPYKIIYEIFESEIMIYGLKHFKQDNYKI